MTEPGGAGGEGGLVGALATAFAAAQEAVAIQHDGVLIAVNAALIALFGWPSVAAARGRRVLELLAPTSHAQVARYLELRQAGAEVPSPYEAVGQRADGSTFPLEVRGTRVELDGVACTLAFIRDVTALHVAETTRRDREAMYKALFEVNAAIKLLIDPVDGRIVDANPAAAQFYGWSLDELRQMHIGDINTLSRGEVTAEMERARSRRRTSFQFRHRTRSGALADVEVHSGPLELGGKMLLLSIIHDVTERNRFEEQLRHAQRLEAIGRLAAGIAHDFNNLLTVISASVQLAERGPSPERLARCLADAREATRRGADLSRHLLALGREQTLTPSPVCLQRMLTNLASLLQRVLGDAIDVTAEVGDGLPRVQVDPGQLELVLINMALNARDAMPSGGRLVFGAHVPAAPPAGLDGVSLVAITVTDDGTGMDEITRRRVFEPFFTTKEMGAGSGLGLAVAFGFAAQSGGTVTVDSRLGAGTRFTLFLPAVDDAAVHEEPAAPPSAPLAGTILLVDDQPQVRDTLARLLGELGATVHVASGAAAALAVLDGLPVAPDVVLSDVTMAGGSGLALAADLAARWPALPVILMSGHADRSESRGTAAAFLQKPFTMAALTAVLREVAPACVRDA